jgi:hypothetical protein
MVDYFYLLVESFVDKSLLSHLLYLLLSDYLSSLVGKVHYYP